MMSNPPLTPAQEQTALQEVVTWINANTTNIPLPTDERSLIAQGCLDVAIEHQAAILLLHKAELLGSMFALLRILAESLVRGIWLMNCATEAELKRFKQRGIEKEFGALIAEIEAQPGHTNQALSTMKITGWKALNDFTHTGYSQVLRRHGTGFVGGNYPEEEVAKVLSVAGALGLVAAGALIQMIGKPELGVAAIERMEQYANRKR
jgi:hypothetical protein